jgi:hypothetical protein
MIEITRPDQCDSKIGLSVKNIEEGPSICRQRFESWREPRRHRSIAGRNAEAVDA